MVFNLSHVYGLTETYGPASVCAKHPEWDRLPIDLQAARNGRQGVRYHMQEAITVLDPVSMEPVPWDGETMGAPHMWLTLCSLIRPKIRAGSTLRRQTLVPALAARVHGKHQPLQWNIGRVHK